MDLILLQNNDFFYNGLEKAASSELLRQNLFRKNKAEGLISLLEESFTPTGETESFTFWRSFSAHCMREFCLSCDDSERSNPNLAALKSFIEKAPLTPGSKPLDLAFLETLQADILCLLWEMASKFPSPRDFLKSKFPHWFDVGKIHFHLAENPKEGSQSFIFLATYTSRLSHKKRSQHMSFGKALQSSLSDENKDLALKLLQPVKEASHESPFLKKLLDSGKFYSPALLNGKETQSFLEDFPIYEAHGIRVLLPKTWEGKKPQKAKVSLQLEEKQSSEFLSFHSLFQFRPILTLKGSTLGHEELIAILESSDGLIKIRGKWVDVNREKLQKILHYWEKARSLNEKGLSFAEACRLLGKCQINLETKESSSLESDLLEINSSENLAQLTEKLKQPTKIEKDKHLKTLAGPLRATLRPYQESGVLWLKLLREKELGGCLSDDMGLGKTLQMIAALLLDKLSPQASHSPRSSLLVAPSSLLGNWASELKKFAPSLRFKILHRHFDISKREIDHLEKDRQKYDLFITSYHMLHRIPWLLRQEWSYGILDEAQMIKNPSAQISKSCKNLMACCKVALTGTPVENNVLDLWSLYDFCLPGLLGSFTEFQSFYGKMKENDSFKPLKELLKPYLLRRVKTDKSIIQDLPDKIERKIHCFLRPEQVKLYRDELKSLSNELKKTESDSKRKGLVLTYLLKFKQICNHPSQFLSDSDYSFEKSGKFLELKRIAETISSKREKLLVFTQFREITDILDSFLEKIFQQKGLVLHGGTPTKKRKELVDRFQQDPSCPYFVLSLKAGGSGLNLTQANHVVHFDRWWNPAVERQASDRSFRIGQEKNVMVYKFITKGTLEEKIDHLISQKEDLIYDLIESENFKLFSLSNSEVFNLMSLNSEEEDPK